MTFAEMFLLVAGGAGLYFLLGPLQRRLERYLVRKLGKRRPRFPGRTIDVTDFTSSDSRRKEDRDA